MSKNVKVIVILAITALVIGMLIYFYNKKKKEAEAAAKLALGAPVVNPTAVAKAKRMADMVAAGQVSVAGPKPVGGPAMSTN
jgi:hypothetical protein